MTLYNGTRHLYYYISRIAKMTQSVSS